MDDKRKLELVEALRNQSKRYGFPTIPKKKKKAKKDDRVKS